MKHICCGACPLYWDERGGFDELKDLLPPASRRASLRWRLRRLRRQSWGIGLRRARPWAEEGAGEDA